MTSPPNPRCLSQQTVAIIGAGGFLGTNLAARLKPLVGQLRCMGQHRHFPEIFDNIRWIQGRIENEIALDEILAECQIVIHLASTSTPGTADRNIELDAAANVLSSLHLFERCVKCGVEKVIFLSSGGTVYGIPNQIPTPEAAATNPITAYGVAKLTIEKYLEIYRRQKNLDYRILRVANVYGPFQMANKQQGVIGAFLEKSLRAEPLEIWGDGNVIRDYVFVTDVADAIVAAMKHNSGSRVFNIGSGMGLSINEVLAQIEILLGRQLQTVYRPCRPVDVPVSILDCGLAYSELGWHAGTVFTDGLRMAAEWMKTRCST